MNDLDYCRVLCDPLLSSEEAKWESLFPTVGDLLPNQTDSDRVWASVAGQPNDVGVYTPDPNLIAL